MKKFQALGLSETTLEALERKGFEEPTEVQALTIPLVIKNEKDIIAQAQTGTGKTAAFGLPLIEKLEPGRKKPQVIILAPTRELVVQVCEEMNSFKTGRATSIAAIYGGQSMGLQLKKLKQGVSIVVGTPGRVIDHIKRGSLALDELRFFVLDEADEMLNMGFADDIETILSHTNSSKRVLLFSATMPARIKKIAEEYMGEYDHVTTSRKVTEHLTDQIYFEVNQRDKFEALCRIIDMEPLFFGIVFCRTKVGVDEVANRLNERGYSAAGLHGDMSQGHRENILRAFKKKRLTILVATDVASRGIDVHNITHVINFAIPQDPESYVHRIGRTGRAGQRGTAITFITPSEFRKLGFIKRITKSDIEKRDLPAVDDIIQAKRAHIEGAVQKFLSEDQDNTEQYEDWARQMLQENEPEKVLAGVLQYAFQAQLNEDKYEEIVAPRQKRGRPVEDLERSGKTRLFIARGKVGGYSKPDIVSFITETSGVPSPRIDDVTLFDKFCFVTVSFDDAETILRAFQKIARGKRSLVTRAKSGKPRRGKPPFKKYGGKKRFRS
ncbi:DEAD/DEAH box helicase [Chitinivibrio alkaliphilus]|uniref:RNA helicase n=1 Tax=Chitinivibrio alkaliphilus ACht1 TaxID=1313304 RepID=U7D836_9BACT|nr:DEAD/DEAH box helicase [Chitinivibrio alkaliphilus]ERP31736.1 ATP-dependent RNA helicase [Chitinivibrio alkaliphilus ACht1]